MVGVAYFIFLNNCEHNFLNPFAEWKDVTFGVAGP